MNILITGAKGFVGRNLAENLKNIRDGKDRTRSLDIREIYEYGRDSGSGLLETACARCDFVFHLAGVNRPADESEFTDDNVAFTERLLHTLKKYNNPCPVMYSSSIQASLTGRYRDSAYGRSKLEAEKLCFLYGQQTGGSVRVYRLPNLFGKWCPPDAHSVVATFCQRAAEGREYTVTDRNRRLELLYIDDLVQGLLDALEGRLLRCEYNGQTLEERPDGRYCYVSGSHEVTLGEISDLIRSFQAMPDTLYMPDIPAGSFAGKLYSTYQSYLPAGRTAYELIMRKDRRGMFAELLKTASCGQFSVNVVSPGCERGQHWHNSRWEIFFVVSGRGVVRQRRTGTDRDGKRYPVTEIQVSGERIQAVQMLPGYTHSIRNLSGTENLVFLIWADRVFDPQRPDTFYEEV